MFRVTDLLGILAGGAWLTKESVKCSLELEENKANARQVLSFIEENTDESLERMYREDIKNPKCYDDIWRTLELFKRDNPVWCARHVEWGWVGQYTKTHYSPVYGWQDVGKERIALHESRTPRRMKSKESEAGKTAIEINRGIILNMLMQTHGKMTVGIARIEAKKKYPLPKHK